MEWASRKFRTYHGLISSVKPTESSHQMSSAILQCFHHFQHLQSIAIIYITYYCSKETRLELTFKKLRSIYLNPIFIPCIPCLRSPGSLLHSLMGLQPGRKEQNAALTSPHSPYSLHSTPLHSTPLHSTRLDSTRLDSTPLHSTPLTHRVSSRP